MKALQTRIAGKLTFNNSNWAMSGRFLLGFNLHKMQFIILEVGVATQSE
jgi:hypothetical protein